MSLPPVVQNSAQALKLTFSEHVTPIIWLALAYYVLAWLGTHFQFEESQTSPVWPQSGLALAAVLMWGLRASPGIFLGALCANIGDFYIRAGGSELIHLEGLFRHLSEHPQHIFISMAIGVGHTLEALVGRRLIRTFDVDANIFGSIRGVLAFCISALVACSIGSTFEVMSLISRGDLLAPDVIKHAWLTSLLSGVNGILIVTPFLITWWSIRNVKVNYAAILLPAVILVLLFVFAQIIFTGWFEVDSLRRAYLIFPFLIVVTFRFGAPTATIGILVVSASAVFATLTGSGPLVGSNQIETLINLEGFLSIASMTVLFLDATNSERRHALADSMQALEQFRTLFKGSPNGLVAVGGDGLIRLVNARVATMFGYGRDELVGRRLETLVPENVRTLHSALRKELSDLPEVVADRDLVGRRRDGTQFPIEVLLNPLETSPCSLVLVTIIDITERRRAEDELTAALIERDELRRHLIQAQEQERMRLSRELHDQTGQVLTAAMLELKGIETQVDQDGRSRLRHLRNQLEQIETTISRIAWELRPASIDELGLASALANYVMGWSRQLKIEVDLHCPDDLDDIADEIRTAIYRIAQEALTNIAKHAEGVTAVSIILDRAASVIRLTIEDNGCGFNTDLLAPPRGFNRGGHGIAGMRERLFLIGGKLEIESALGVGTTLFARIPITPERLTR